MTDMRVISRLDIKGPNLIKGIQFEGLRVIGDPAEFALKYYDEGADELLYVDFVASLYERDSLAEIVRKTAERAFIPMTVGGGIRTVADVEKLLRSGADKVAINTAAVKTPELITNVASTFGSQCMVLQLDVKKIPDGYEVYIDGGREKTGIDAFEWLKKAQDLGCGEILLTSIDRDGTKKGFDTELLKRVYDIARVPVIACGGFGDMSHLDSFKQGTLSDAIAIGTGFHRGIATPTSVKAYLRT